jgi:hypothetical protein
MNWLMKECPTKILKGKRPTIKIGDELIVKESISSGEQLGDVGNAI